MVLHFCSRLSHSKRFQVPEPPFNSVSTWETTFDCGVSALGTSMLSRFPLDLENNEIILKSSYKVCATQKQPADFFEGKGNTL